MKRDSELRLSQFPVQPRRSRVTVATVTEITNFGGETALWVPCFVFTHLFGSAVYV